MCEREMDRRNKSNLSSYNNWVQKQKKIHLNEAKKKNKNQIKKENINSVKAL